MLNCHLHRNESFGVTDVLSMYDLYSNCIPYIYKLSHVGCINVSWVGGYGERHISMRGVLRIQYSEKAQLALYPCICT